MGQDRVPASRTNTDTLSTKAVHKSVDGVPPRGFAQRNFP
jgi:hypothetical protein